MRDHSLWGDSLHTFLQRTASSDPTPGGGSVAGVSAAFGMGLVLMALRVSEKHLVPSQGEEFATLVSRCSGCLEGIERCPDADIEAFDRYMAALGMPKGTDGEKSARKEALLAATVGATETPLAAGSFMYEGLILAERALPLAHRHVVSDVGAGAALLGGALRAVLLNVSINVAGMRDETVKRGFLERAAEIEHKGAEAEARVMAGVKEKIGG